MIIRTLDGMRSAFAVIVYIAGIYLSISPQLQASEVQVGRYSMITATPNEAQADLLAATMTARFPEWIQTVGEAVRYLLQRSGYRLATTESIGPDTAALFALPIPAVHRGLGPMMLRDALETLVGPAFNLVQDPVHRLITFERCATNRLATQAVGINLEKEVAQDEE